MSEFGPLWEEELGALTLVQLKVGLNFVLRDANGVNPDVSGTIAGLPDNGVQVVLVRWSGSDKPVAVASFNLGLVSYYGMRGHRYMVAA